MRTRSPCTCTTNTVLYETLLVYELGFMHYREAHTAGWLKPVRAIDPINSVSY